MRQHEMAAKMAGPDGRSVVYGGIVLPPGEASAAVATAIAAASDERDARPRSVVEAEVLERLTKRSPAKPATPKDHPPPAFRVAEWSMRKVAPRMVRVRFLVGSHARLLVGSLVPARIERVDPNEKPPAS